MNPKQKNKKHSLALAIAAGVLTGLFAVQTVRAEENLPAAPAAPYTFKDPFVSFLPQQQAESVAETIEMGDTGQPSIELPALQVNGIVWNTDRPQAIINSYVVSIGDVIAEARITGISRGGVSLEYKGKHFIIDPNKNIAEPIEQIN